MGYIAALIGDEGDREVWRTGRSVGRTIYRQAGDEASRRDVLIGLMDTPELAALVVAAVNAYPQAL